MVAIRIHRFFSFIDQSDGPTACWPWNGQTLKGYGRYGSTLAHRVAYELMVGPIPSGLAIHHLCRTPLCVNPTHLEPVTSWENIQRRQALVTRCIHGHDFTPENTRVSARQRACRACERRRSAAYKARKKAAA